MPVPTYLIQENYVKLRTLLLAIPLFLAALPSQADVWAYQLHRAIITHCSLESYDTTALEDQTLALALPPLYEGQKCRVFDTAGDGDFYVRGDVVLHAKSWAAPIESFDYEATVCDMSEQAAPGEINFSSPCYDLAGAYTFYDYSWTGGIYGQNGREVHFIRRGVKPDASDNSMIVWIDYGEVKPGESLQVMYDFRP